MNMYNSYSMRRPHAYMQQKCYFHFNINFFKKLVIGEFKCNRHIHEFQTSHFLSTRNDTCIFIYMIYYSYMDGVLKFCMHGIRTIPPPLQFDHDNPFSTTSWILLLIFVEAFTTTMLFLKFLHKHRILGMEYAHTWQGSLDREHKTGKTFFPCRINVPTLPFFILHI